MSTEHTDQPAQEVIRLTPTSDTTLFAGGTPSAILARATETAEALADLIASRNLYHNIRGRSYVTVEGWTALGTLVGVTPVVAWTRELDTQGDWEARVEARTLDGRIIGAAEAECRQAEGGNWGPKSTSNARRAMAQTRATSRALRGPLGFIISIAGYQATAPEEIPDAHTPSELQGAALDTYGLLTGIVTRDPDTGKTTVKEQLILHGATDLTSVRAALLTIPDPGIKALHEWATSQTPSELL